MNAVLNHSFSWSQACLAALATLASFCTPVRAANEDFTDLSLAELVNEPVTSVSKKETRLADAPTAITVITGEDIRRLGITSIAEALRLVPGFAVARVDGSHWAIGARGFNFEYANTLLVLVDGRSVYTPSFGGVYWDSQDTSLDDLDRIEVIRGPGAALWGANAMNGVVNVISKNSQETQGLHLSGTLGTEDQPAMQARYGGEIGSDAHYRVYAKYFDRDGFPDEVGNPTPDAWKSARMGFRTDWNRSAEQLVTVQGDYYSLHTEHLVSFIELTPPFRSLKRSDEVAKGGNLIARWTEVLSSTSHVMLQAYVDSYDRTGESRDTLDVQVEHRFAAAAAHDVVWGAGYRVTEDDVHVLETAVTEPASVSASLYTAFLQDEMIIVPERLRFTLGAKIERNEVTGIETQPNVRLLWTPAARHDLWAAASRAVSAPPRIVSDTRFSVFAFQPPFSPVIESALMPNPDLPAESVEAYELGYRFHNDASFSADLATFYDVYHGILQALPGDPVFELQPIPHVLVPLNWTPSLTGVAYGAELSLNWSPLSAWRLTGTYSWLHLRVSPTPLYEAVSPAHQVSLRSYANLTSKLELNAVVSYVGPTESLSSATENIPIPSYVRLNVGFVLHPFAATEIGFWGQNLLDKRHAETSSQDNQLVMEIPRSFLLKVTRHF